MFKKLSVMVVREDALCAEKLSEKLPLGRLLGHCWHKRGSILDILKILSKCCWHEPNAGRLVSVRNSRDQTYTPLPMIP